MVSAMSAMEAYVRAILERDPLWHQYPDQAEHELSVILHHNLHGATPADTDLIARAVQAWRTSVKTFGGRPQSRR